ncbi:hypothetical protein GZ77_19330 [Endozoicomonas montiporae]|uniref:Uncharacterized protein n=2 Tax=Endozoicomonas montiporae TaxID=1027273 RepID=A0A081N2H8_9GAMM|nr:hypothetical protein GZ77_19330 [Endozoicomonas montiporae]
MNMVSCNEQLTASGPFSKRDLRKCEKGRLEIKTFDSVEPKLSIYLDKLHGFIRLTIPERNIDAFRGFYPKNYLGGREDVRCDDENDLELDQFSKVHFEGKLPDEEAASDDIEAKRELLREYYHKIPDMKENLKFLSVAGDTIGSIVNEKVVYGQNSSYVRPGFFDPYPHVDFPITASEARSLEHFIADAQVTCNSPDGTDGTACIYNLAEFNCLDFVQKVFEKTDYSGHFSNYFPYSKMTDSYSGRYLAMFKSDKPSYTASKVAEAISVNGTIMLGATLLKSLPQLAKSLLPETPLADSEGKMISPAKLEKAVLNAGKTCHFLDKVFEDYYAVNDVPVPGELVELSVDIQSKIYDLEMFVKKHGYKESVRPYIKKELKEINEGVRDFIERFPKSQGLRIKLKQSYLSCRG